MRVVVADDAALLRDGVSGLLERAGHDVVGACGDPETLVSLVQQLRPDVAVVDVRMPPTCTTEGLQAAAAIRALGLRVGVLLLSQHVETASLAELLAEGADGLGYLLKDRVADVAEFVDALERVASGGTAIDPEVVGRLLAKPRAADPLDQLSPRERDVLALMAEGQSNAGIARRLVVSERTVEAHVRSILTRLDVDTSADSHRRVLAVIRFLRRS